MRVVFWTCLAVILYTYVGYVVYLWFYVRFHKRPIRQEAITPSVSVIIAAHNEQNSLPAKLENLRRMEYPNAQLQVIVASDGSTDRTADILRDHASTVDSVILEAANGKAAAINQAVKLAKGDILVLMDTRQRVALDAVTQLVACFADDEVGAASGELLLDTEPDNSSSDSLGIYWKIEKVVRKLESASGSVVGVTGAIYAIRRELYTEMPSGTILDDVFVPMHVARAGKRVVFQPSALSYDRLSPAKGKEFSRKVRTLTGNYQLLRLAPWLLSASNPLWFRLISHKLLRLAVPLFLFLMLLSCAGVPTAFFRVAFWLQVALYVAAFIGAVAPSSRRVKPVSIAYTFVMLNVAATVAFYNFIAGRYKVWT